MGLCFLGCLCKQFTCKWAGPLFGSVLMSSFELALSPGCGTCGLGPCTGSAKFGDAFTLLKLQRDGFICLIVRFISSHSVNSCIGVTFWFPLLHNTWNYRKNKCKCCVWIRTGTKPVFLSNNTFSGLFLAINCLMVINPILHYGDPKARTKRLWGTELFPTGLLCPLSNIFPPLENGGLAYT